MNHGKSRSQQARGPDRPASTLIRITITTMVVGMVMHGITTQSINTRMAIAVALNLTPVVIEGGFDLSNSVALIASGP
jgi:hypothetical protein